MWTRDGERKENVRVFVMMDVYDENMAAPCGDYGGATACDLFNLRYLVVWSTERSLEFPGKIFVRVLGE